MSLQPNLLERFLIRRGEIPGLLLDVVVSSFQFWALVAAMESGLFEKLGRSSTDVDTVAILDQLAGISGSKFARALAGLIGYNSFLFTGGRNDRYDLLKRWLPT